MPMHELLERARACRLCQETLDPRPVLSLTSSSRILIIGQAPGSRVHASGVPWDDASGAHLREWLGVDEHTFYDPEVFGILPMALCYPGKGANADLPPPAICAETWHDELTSALDRPALTLLVGMYAQRHYLGSARHSTLTETVRRFSEFLPTFFPLPHPSWRSKSWMRRNPWFESDVLPELRAEITRLVNEGEDP